MKFKWNPETGQFEQVVSVGEKIMSDIKTIPYELVNSPREILENAAHLGEQTLQFWSEKIDGLARFSAIISGKEQTYIQAKAWMINPDWSDLVLKLF